MQNILLIGGSGKQSGAVYLPVLLNQSTKGYRLVAIADPIDPLGSQFSKPFSKQLNEVGTVWVNLCADQKSDLTTLSEFLNKSPCDTMIISCPPVNHAAYVELGLKHGMDVIVDKPVVCVPNQFGSSKAAKILKADYARMRELCETSCHRKLNRKCMVFVPLMRRVTSPYTSILNGLRQVYDVTGQQITNIVMTRSDGCFRFSEEFDRPGAHGYREGLGTLTMSGYHYIDFIAACLDATSVSGLALNATLTSKTTVKDVRVISQELPFGKYLKTLSSSSKEPFIGDNAELDFTVHFELKKPGHRLVETDIYFSFIQRGCTRRVTPLYDERATHDEGLTNDCVITIHQGPFQSYQCLVAQDPSTDGRITLVRRLNPVLSKELNASALSINDYPLKNNQNSLNNQKIILSILERFSGITKTNIYDSLRLEEQDLTVQLFMAIIEASVK